MSHGSVEDWVTQNWPRHQNFTFVCKITQQYFTFCTTRDCRLLVSTKCAGMGCDMPDIRLTVCIGQLHLSCFNNLDLFRTS